MPRGETSFNFIFLSLFLVRVRWDHEGPHSECDSSPFTPSPPLTYIRGKTFPVIIIGPPRTHFRASMFETGVFPSYTLVGRERTFDTGRFYLLYRALAQRRARKGCFPGCPMTPQKQLPRPDIAAGLAVSAVLIENARWTEKKQPRHNKDKQTTTTTY